MNDPSLCVVDGNHALHRVLSIDTFRDLHNRNDVLTGGVFGVMTTLRQVLEEFPTVSKCIYVWDGGRSERRRMLYPEYKGNRGKSRTPEEQERYTNLFRDQQDRIQQLLPSLGVHQVVLEGREADDVVGVICRCWPEPKVIVSEDRDMYQFIDEDCIVHRPAHKLTVSTTNFQDETGSPRELFLLQKSLNGDSGDNISGIPEVGETSINRLIECMEDMKIDNSKSFNGLEVPFVQACTEMQSRDKRNMKRYKAMLANMDLIRRNWELVDISRERFRDEEIEVIKVVVDEPVKFQEMEVVRAFGDLEFASLLEKWSWFAGPFRRFK